MDITKLRFLVTGGAGFIGSHIAEHLLKAGAKHVRVLDNLSTGSLNNITHLTQYNNFEFICNTITKYDVCLDACTNIDIICHQAATGSVPKSLLDPCGYHDTNVSGFLNILNAGKDKGVKRIVYASSSSVYGDDESFTKTETQIGKPLSPYALTKYMDELYGEFFTRIYGMECIGLRYFNVFGPRQNPNGDYAAVIPKFTSLLKNKQTPIIYGDGLQSRDFTFVENIVNANFVAMTTNNKECYGQAFNIGTGGSMTVLDLLNNICKILDVSVTPHFVERRNCDILHSLADVTKANNLLKWEPHMSLMDGLEITVKSYN
jgi:UDP-N-acetylglucosamine/UDP-N-acetylgalactosamine 4-epimerase